MIKSKLPVSEAVDPSKLMLPADTFQAEGHSVAQISLKQIGPSPGGLHWCRWKMQFPI